MAFLFVGAVGTVKKNIIWYLVVWLPAFLISIFSDTSSLIPLKWIFAVIMLAGWCANTVMIARSHWRRALSGLLIYVGVNLSVIAALYFSVIDAVRINRTVLNLAGLTSFTPMAVIAHSLFDPGTPQELYILLLIFGLLLICWALGAFYGWRKRRGEATCD